MKQYLELVQHVLENGTKKLNRTGTNTISIFGHQSRYDLSKGLPLVTTKQLHIKSIIYELLWFLKGDTNIKYLNKHNVSIWDKWADKHGDLGRIYGAQWRSWQTSDGNVVNQIANTIEQIKSDPDSRRIVISAWNVGELDKMRLPPCHILFQFHIVNDKISCQLYQRSADVFLGVPFNITSYALLTMMIAQVTDLKPGEFIHTLGDAHLYVNHIEQAQKQLKRTPYILPVLKLNPDIDNIYDFEFEDFEIKDYKYHPHIKAKVSV